MRCDDQLALSVSYSKVAQVIFHVILERWKLCLDVVYPHPCVCLDVTVVVPFRNLQHLRCHLGNRGAVKPSSYVSVVLTCDQKADAARVSRIALTYDFGQDV